MLKFHRHDTHDVVYVRGVGLEGIGGGFDFSVRIEVDLMGKRRELAVYRFHQLLDSFGEEFLRY